MGRAKREKPKTHIWTPAYPYEGFAGVKINNQVYASRYVLDEIQMSGMRHQDRKRLILDELGAFFNRILNQVEEGL